VTVLVGFMGFVAELRRHGVAVTVSAGHDFVWGLCVLGVADRDTVFDVGLATLVKRPEDRALYRIVFDAYFTRTWLPPSGSEMVKELATAFDDDGALDGEGDDDSVANVVRYSAMELLGDTDFAAMTAAERREALALIRQFRWSAPERLSRRLERTGGRGRFLDQPRTMRALARTDGEPVRRYYRSRSPRPRPVVFVVDISGSMAVYAEALLRLSYGAVRGLSRVSVFTLGTRFTDVTREMDNSDPDQAMARVLNRAKDYSGGTRLGDGLWEMSGRREVWGALVVVLSDGWDRGDPVLVSQAMERISLRAMKVIWVNPLVASPGYAPLARGMAAALPWVDSFVDGSRLSSLEALAALISLEGGRGARRDRPRRQLAS